MAPDGDSTPVTEPDWSALPHAYGPAVDTPELIRALRSPEADADEAINELYSSIAHQGTRYPATAAAVPLLVDAALDPSTAARHDVLGLLEFCAVGNFADTLDWRERRDQQQQQGPDAQRAWRTIHDERCDWSFAILMVPLSSVSDALRRHVLPAHVLEYETPRRVPSLPAPSTALAGRGGERTGRTF